MKENFEIVDGITSADIAVRIFGNSMEEILKNAAKAMLAILLENPEKFSPTKKEYIFVGAESEEMLLYYFLDELIFLKDARKALVQLEECTIQNKNEFLEAKGTLAIDVIDLTRHRFNVDIKAVTLHGLSCRKEKDGYKAEVVFDV